MTVHCCVCGGCANSHTLNFQLPQQEEECAAEEAGLWPCFSDETLILNRKSRLRIIRLLIVTCTCTIYSLLFLKTTVSLHVFLEVCLLISSLNVHHSFGSEISK